MRRKHGVQSLAAKRIQRTYRRLKGHHAAATTIQRRFRGQRSIRQLSAAAAAFREVIAQRVALHTANSAATKIQLAYLEHAYTRFERAETIQRAFRSHAMRKRVKAAFAAAALRRPEAITERDLARRTRQQKRKPVNVAFLSPSEEPSVHVDGTLVNGGLVVISPRAKHLDPTAWFATTLENTSEWDTIEERTPLSRHRNRCADVPAPRSPNAPRTANLSMRVDDLVQREVLSGSAARLARISSARDVDHGRQRTPFALERQPSSPPGSPMPPRAAGGGCWPWARRRKVKRVAPASIAYECAASTVPGGDLPLA